MPLHDCRVVLVQTRIAGNLGATARIMRNMGLTQLVLVAPEADPLDREACRLSTHGEHILRQARQVATLEEAVADCTLVVGTSARIGGPFRRQSVGLPAEILPHIAETVRTAPAALVFGPEPTGLSNEDVTRCHYLIHIPADESYPALNLAQAVTICTYELRLAWLRTSESPAPGPPTAPFADQDRMFSHLRTALEEMHFLYGTNADSLMHALRHLIGRARPTPMEVDLLFGLARQLRWYAANHSRPSSAMKKE
ncbi:MAG: RNA methyltransferase [Gemmataceae bacterium]|nr:RNA methyltransferase [Gemmataceae bacterium]